MPPPRARAFVLDHVAAFDDDALRAFLAPGDWGVDVRRLGLALQGERYAELAARVATVLEGDRRAVFVAAQGERAADDVVEAARRHVVRRLFWPLLYWHDPAAYEELVSGEHIHPDLLASLGIAGKVVADLGAGAGRFTLYAARIARRVVAVDIVPALLHRLAGKAQEAGLDNIEIRRGDFCHLPLEDNEVDVAVACSALTSHAPWGGEAALAEAIRIVRPGGEVVVIWPDDPAWFCARGFEYRSLPGNEYLRFADVTTAERICRDFYSDAAAAWVRHHRSAEVPFSVLGMSPPSDACVLRLGAPPPSRPYDAEHPRPGVEVR